MTRALFGHPHKEGVSYNPAAKPLTPKEASKLRILDPACGSGSFLIGAYQYLLNWHRDWYEKDGAEKHATGKTAELFRGPGGEWRLTTAERKRILLNNIYGVDIDSQAVEVTKLSLLLKVLEGENEQTISQQLKMFHERALPDLGSNIKCGNSLIGPDFYEGKQLSLLDDEEKNRINVFDWKSEFKDIMSAGGFDAVIGNPPWGSLLSSEEKDYLAGTYKCFSGNFDSYYFFLDQSVRLTRKRGRVSLITPDTWIRTPQAVALRKIILAETAVDSISTLPSNVFKGVSANCIIAVLQRSVRESQCKVNIMLADSSLSNLRDESFDKSYSVAISLWENNDDLQFQIYQTAEVASLMQKIRSISGRAESFLDVMQGIVPYSSENHSQDTIENRRFHSSKKLSKECGPWIQGRALSRYATDIKHNEYLRYGDWLHRPRLSKYFEGSRILIQEITGGNPSRVSACYVNSLLYHDPGIISCLNISNVDTRFLLGVVNSELISWYHRHCSPKGSRKAFPKILIGDIRDLPIHSINFSDLSDKSRHDKMVQLVEQMLSLHKQLPAAKTEQEKTVIQRQIEATDKQIDALVYELYGLTKEEIAIVEG